jgi:hypothetical protein
MEYRLRANLQIKEKNILNFTKNACNGTSPFCIIKLKGKTKVIITCK